MTMERSVAGLKSHGDYDLAKEAARILEEFQKRHPGVGDIPSRGRLLQPRTVRTELVFPPLSPETQKLIERMLGDGYAVYATTGRTPASLRADGMRYLSLDDKLADITAPPALLAFKKAPPEFFLPGSFNIPHDEQVKLIPAEQANVDAEYPGAGLIVDEGGFPEWTEVALQHFKVTGVRILGKDFGYRSTWTKTYGSNDRGASRADFGHWRETGGAHADLWGPGHVLPHLGLAALVRIPWK